MNPYLSNALVGGGAGLLGGVVSKIAPGDAFGKLTAGDIGAMGLGGAAGGAASTSFNGDMLGSPTEDPGVFGPMIGGGSAGVGAIGGLALKRKLMGQPVFPDPNKVAEFPFTEILKLAGLPKSPLLKGEGKVLGVMKRPIGLGHGLDATTSAANEKTVRDAVEKTTMAQTGRGSYELKSAEI